MVSIPHQSKINELSMLEGVGGSVSPGSQGTF